MMIRYLLLFFLFFIRANIYGQTIHFIVFADTDDPKIGSNNLKTYTALMGSSGFGVDLAQHTGLSLKRYGYYGSNCRLSELDHVLQSIEVTKKDIVFFYFIGHGFNNRSNEFPSLIFGNANNPELVDASSQNLQVIYDRFNALHPQLTIAIGEACNKERNSQPISINSGRAIDVMPANVWDSKRVKSLFNYSKGGIILCSSSRNQFSYSDAKGGWMSVSLLNSFQQYFISSNNPLVSWDQLLFNVSNTTERIAKENNQEQTPQFKTFITSIKEVQPEGKEKKSTANTLEIICPPTKYYINETALSGINEDLPLLEEMYNSINTENSKLYAESYIEFYRNQKPFYERLDKILFNYINNIPLKCKKELDKEIEWVKSDMTEINERYKTVYKYANKPQQLVLQARSELPSIIAKLNNIISSFGDQ